MCFLQKNTVISLMSSVKESGAVALLKRAVELDNDGRCDEALSCYQSGIEQLMTVMKGLYHCNLQIETSHEFSKLPVSLHGLIL